MVDTADDSISVFMHLARSMELIGHRNSAMMQSSQWNPHYHNLGWTSDLSDFKSEGKLRTETFHNISHNIRLTSEWVIAF